MVLRWSIVSILTGLLWSVSGCRSGQKASESDTEAVFTDNTSVKSQGNVGFCWAYAAVGMIEADFKRRTGREIDLSEEAIGFFHFAEQLKANMDSNLQNNEKKYLLHQGNFVQGRSQAMGSKAGFALIERWGLIPESQWTEKFSTADETSEKLRAIEQGFYALQYKLNSKQKSVQLNQIFSFLTSTEFTAVAPFKSTPPVDGFDNGSGQMNSVKYARDVIGFQASDYYDLIIAGTQSKPALESTLQRVKTTVASGRVVGLTISMPSGTDWGQRIVGTRFVGRGQPYNVEGAHVMIITDFRNSGGTFGPSVNVNQELAKPLDTGFQLKLKNSWGSQTGQNEFGQIVQTGLYDIDMGYLLDTLESKNGYMIFTFPRN